MTTMIERVARALCEADDFDPDEIASPPGLEHKRLERWRQYVPKAAAAIAAMREPTEGMEDAGRDYIEDDKTRTLPIYASVVFGLMIDAALEEKL